MVVLDDEVKDSDEAVTMELEELVEIGVVVVWFLCVAVVRLEVVFGTGLNVDEVDDKDREVVRELAVVDLVPVPAFVSVPVFDKLRGPVERPVGRPSSLVILLLLVFPLIVRSPSSKESSSAAGLVFRVVVAVARLVVSASWSSVRGDVSCGGRNGMRSSIWSASERSILVG